MEIKTQIMLRIPKRDGEGEPIRMNPDYSKGVYVTASAEAECGIIAQNWKTQEEEKKRLSKVNTF